MKKYKNAFLRFVLDERGQSTTEYILILSVVVMIALRFKGLFETQLSGLINKVGGDLLKATN